MGVAKMPMNVLGNWCILPIWQYNETKKA